MASQAGNKSVDAIPDRRPPISGVSAGGEQPANGEHSTTARLLLAYQDVVSELGGNPEAWLDEAGIAQGAADDPAAQVPLRSLGQLLEDTAARLNCPDFGMRLAERQSMQATMQPLDRLFCTAPTVRDAFECCIRHIVAFNSGLIMELEDDFYDEGEGGFLHFQLLDGLSLFPQLLEQLLLLTHHSVLFLSAGFARSRTVWLSHLNIAPPVAYAKRFNTVVKFGQEYDGLFFGNADLASRVADCDSQSFAKEAQIVAERFPAYRKDIDIKVRQAVFRLLTSSEICTRENIARQLGLQERTLNRRLSKRGTSFEAIRDEVRRNLAFRYLARDDLSLTEIAGRLGYSELAVLSRSCRRWFGTAPRRLRQDLLTARSLPAREGRQLAS
ncbi:MAG: AraC family transcriptional regulator ligand-binding domain-containing protein [Novosphingobium sp.]|nr:AraC family transcriptional regulator ligand-binding domain-containing protein [Novosphingobium sp.]